jgi:hypothetical protein
MFGSAQYPKVAYMTQNLSPLSGVKRTSRFDRVIPLLTQSGHIGRLPLKDFQPAALTRYDASVKKKVDAPRTSNSIP